MVAAVNSLTQNFAQVGRAAKDATSLVAQGALAGVNLATDSASLACRTITQGAQDLWAGSDLFRLDGAGNILVRHTDGLFISMQQLLEGPLLPQVEPLAVNQTLEFLLDFYDDVLIGNREALNWNQAQWSAFFSSGGIARESEWFEMIFKDAVPLDELGAALARCQLSGSELDALMGAFQSDMQIASPAEFIQFYVRSVRPDTAVVKKAVDQFPVSFAEQRFLGPEGVLVSGQELIDGPVVYPRVEEYFTWARQRENLEVRGMEQAFLFRQMSPAERVQLDLRYYEALWQGALQPSSVPLSFADHGGKSWTLAELRATADLSDFSELHELNRAYGLTDAFTDEMTREGFQNLVAVLSAKHPALQNWLSQVRYSEFEAVLRGEGITDNFAQFMTLADSVAKRQLDAAVQALSPADRIRWFFVS